MAFSRFYFTPFTPRRNMPSISLITWYIHFRILQSVLIITTCFSPLWGFLLVVSTKKGLRKTLKIVYWVTTVMKPIFRKRNLSFSLEPKTRDRKIERHLEKWVFRKRTPLISRGWNWRELILFAKPFLREMIFFTKLQFEKKIIPAMGFVFLRKK